MIFRNMLLSRIVEFWNYELGWNWNNGRTRGGPKKAKKLNLNRLNNSNWIFVGMYSDEGITASNTKRREGFNQMIEDALAGKILWKSRTVRI